MSFESKRTKKIGLISSVSNPDIVYHNAVIHLGQYNNFELEYSTRKSKKYMIKGEFTKYKWVHFGDINYPDYTFTKSEEKRKLFLKRNKHWIKEYPKYSPAWFSYNLLW